MKADLTTIVFMKKQKKGHKQEMKCHGIFHFWILYDDQFIKHTLKISVIFFYNFGNILFLLFD